MNRSLKIVFNGPEHPSVDTVHRFRNFGEDLHREFTETGLAQVSLEEIDAARFEFHIQVKSKQYLRRVTARVEKILQEHNLVEQFTLSSG